IKRGEKQPVNGTWIPYDVRIMWITVYAPQSLYDKIALWSSLSRLINNWDGILISLGNFNMGSKMSKLDRFLVFESFFDAFPNTIGVILEKGVPDHRHILLKEHLADFGPTPFRFFHSWLDLDSFHSLVRETWINDEHIHRLSSIDAKIDQCIASDFDFSSRRDLTKIMKDMDRLEANDLAQKARIKWALEGDKISSFFHALLKKNRHQLAIKGVFNNGEWLEDPDCVKSAFVDHFRSRFHHENSDRPSFDIQMLNLLPHDQRVFLDRDVSHEEIKRAVWDCGSDRAPGVLTGLPLNSSPLSGTLLNLMFPEQSAFIKGRNILDGPLILNEVINWYQKRKENLMIFKVDFEKGCFTNVRSSILVNGSPTMEFDISKGLRQGDPLSPFLFILAMEGLHALICKAINMGIYRGAIIGHDYTRISHLIYVDDVIFVGYWSATNVNNLLCILRCFFLVSGLKINVQKCSLLGVGVSDDEVLNMAHIIGCGVADFLFKYLGVPVGGNMSRCHNWETVVNKFTSKLSLWKTRLLSIRGRITLIKSVLGNLPTYFMSLYFMPVTVRFKLESMRL
nr:hypothetical protein [Tanacetum cinerariifolium]